MSTRLPNAQSERDPLIKSLFFWLGVQPKIMFVRQSIKTPCRHAANIEQLCNTRSSLSGDC